MTSTTATPWPPPPDLASIRELVATADIEGLVEIHGAPADEYEPEADKLFHAIQNFPTASLTTSTLLPILEDIWHQSFNLDDKDLAKRRPTLEALAALIARFFGPEAQPQTR